MNKTYHLSIRNKKKTVRHKDWCTQLDSKNVKMNLRKYRKKWKNLGNKYVASENKNKFIFKKTTRKVGSGETKKVPLHPPNHPSFFSPYMLHTLLNTFLKLLRYSKYWGGGKRSPLCSLNSTECLSPHSKLAQHESEVKERNSLMS